MADKKYQVFISSTYTDLIEERRKILDILLMADCIPAGMEAFVATDEEQFNVIKKVIDLCDYYILIIGKRYGSINQSTGISYTEMEYEYAKEKGIPILVFAINDSIELPEDKIESAPEKAAALKRFREKAMTNRLVQFWNSADDLAGQVAISIMRAKNEISRPGWQRAADYDEASLRREIMRLQKDKAAAIVELNKVKKELISLTTTSDLAFDECEFTIKCFDLYPENTKIVHKTITIKLPELFKIISVQMLNKSMSEENIADCLTCNLFDFTPPFSRFSDRQLVKKIILQLSGLGLIQHTEDGLFSNNWALTPKGIQVRNNLVLIKQSSCDNSNKVD